MRIDPTQVLHSAGDCPVCPGSGDLIVLISRVDARPVYFCPMCETAWPDPLTFDTIQGPHELAPYGVRLPSQEDLDALEDDGVMTRVLRDDLSIWVLNELFEAQDAR